MIFDTLDGRVARMTRTESAFGKEYDSLADMVSFGLAPAIVCLPVGCGADLRVRPVCGGASAGSPRSSTRSRRACASRASTRARHAGQALSSKGCRALPAAAIVAAFIWLVQRVARAGPVGTDRRIPGHGCSPARSWSASSATTASRTVDLTGACATSTTSILVPLVFVLIALDPPTVLLADLRHLRAVGPGVAGSRSERRADAPARWRAGPTGRRGVRAMQVAPATILRRPWKCALRAARPQRCGREHADAARRGTPARRRTGRRCARATVARIAGLCALCETRGPRPCSASATRRRDWMVIGEAPGAEEDRAGRALRRSRRACCSTPCCALRACARERGVHRQHPQVPAAEQPRPKPTRKRRAACRTCARQIELIAAAAHPVRGAHRRADAARHRHADRQAARPRAPLRTAEPVVVTYHPAYLLRSPGEKRKAWEDLQVRARRAGARERRWRPRETSQPRAGDPPDGPGGRARGGRARARVLRISLERPGIFRDCLRVGYLCLVVDTVGGVVGYGVHVDGRGRGARPQPVRAPRAAAGAASGAGCSLTLLDPRATAACATPSSKCVRPTARAIPLYQALGLRVASARGAATTRRGRARRCARVPARARGHALR